MVLGDPGTNGFVQSQLEGPLPLGRKKIHLDGRLANHLPDHAASNDRAQGTPISSDEARVVQIDFSVIGQPPAPPLWAGYWGIQPLPSPETIVRFEEQIVVVRSCGPRIHLVSGNRKAVGWHAIGLENHRASVPKGMHLQVEGNFLRATAITRL